MNLHNTCIAYILYNVPMCEISRELQSAAHFRPWPMSARPIAAVLLLVRLLPNKHVSLRVFQHLIPSPSLPANNLFKHFYHPLLLALNTLPVKFCNSAGDMRGLASRSSSLVCIERKGAQNAREMRGCAQLQINQRNFTTYKPSHGKVRTPVSQVAKSVDFTLLRQTHYPFSSC
jgi:hypothetical protein